VPRHEGLRGRVREAGYAATNTRVAIRDVCALYSDCPSGRTIAGSSRADVNGLVGLPPHAYAPHSWPAVCRFSFSDLDEAQRAVMAHKPVPRRPAAARVTPSPDRITDPQARSPHA
jgi:hypothetical protein